MDRTKELRTDSRPPRPAGARRITTDGLAKRIRRAGARLRDVRLERGESLIEAGEKLGVSAGWLSRIERGHVDVIDVRTAQAIEREYGIATESWTQAA